MKSERSRRGWLRWLCTAVVLGMLGSLLGAAEAQAQVQTFFVNVPAASEQREAMELCRDRFTAALVRVGGFRANQDAITQQSVTDCLGETASATAKRECEVSMANIEVDFLIQLVVRRLGTEWNWGIKALSPAQGAAQVWGGDQRVGGDASEAGYEACDSLARQFACDQGVSSACVGSGFGAGPILGAEAAAPAQGSGPARAQPARSRLSALEVLEPTPQVVSVWIDGKEAGTSENQITGVPAGQHSVTLKATGYFDHTEQLAFAAGVPSELKGVRLRKTTATLRVEMVEPPVATVFIGGRERGTTANPLAGIAPGEVEVVLRAEGYRERRERVTLEADKETALGSIRLEPLLATLTVTANILGAEIVLDGKVIGATTGGPDSFEVAPSAKQLEVRRSGYMTAVKGLALGPGVTSQVDVLLVRHPALDAHPQRGAASRQVTSQDPSAAAMEFGRQDAVEAGYTRPSGYQSPIQTFFVNVPAASELRDAIEVCRDRFTDALVRVGGFRANQDADTQRSVTDVLGETASAAAKRELEVSMALIEVDFLILPSVRRLGDHWKWSIKALSPVQGAAQVWGGDGSSVEADASKAAYDACESLAKDFACEQGVERACSGSGFGGGPWLGADAAGPTEGGTPRAAPRRVNVSALDVFDIVPTEVAVWIDGKESGTSANQVTGIPPGEHEVTLKATGYADLSQRLSFVAGRATVVQDVRLQKTTGGCPAGYVRIAPGAFTMGSPTGEEGREDDETQHRVTITRGYCMKATEVTQGEWQAVMGSNPSQFTNCGANCPVEQVSWDDAVGYANALSRREGLPECYSDSTFTGLGCRGYRLPTEAEWEYAARAGTTGATYGNLDSVAWFAANSGAATHPARQKQPNAWGLYDMLGNVWEWTGDLYAEYAGSASDPAGAAAGSFRMIRGGSWGNLARNARAAFRYDGRPDNRYGSFGLRLVRTAVPVAAPSGGRAVRPSPKPGATSDPYAD